MDFTKITNKLKLVDGADESSILSAINSLEEKVQEAELAGATATAKVDELQALLDQVSADLETAKAEAEAAKDETATMEATEAVNKYVSRIGNKAEVITKWVKLMKADKDGTIEMIESLPLNVTSNRVETGNEKSTGTGLTAAGVMNEINNRKK